MTNNGTTATDPALVRFSLRLREDYLARIEDEAEAEDRSVNWMLNHAVAEYLERSK